MNSPLLGILITAVSYILGFHIAQKLKITIFNKFIIAVLISILMLVLFRIDFSLYDKGGSLITSLIPIIVICLAVPVYKNRIILSKYKWIFLLALIMGLLLNGLMVYMALSLFDLPYNLSVAMYTKSITTPMALSLHDLLGTDKDIAVLMITIASFVAPLFGKLIIKIVKPKSEFSKGIALGLFSHVIGAITAVEESEEAGSVAIVALTLAGVVTVLVIPLLIQYMIV